MRKTKKGEKKALCADISLNIDHNNRIKPSARADGFVFCKNHAKLTVAIDEYDNVAFRLFYHIVDGDFRHMTLKSVMSQVLSLSRIFIVPWSDFKTLEKTSIDVYRICRILFFDFFRHSMYNRWDGRKYMSRMGMPQDNYGSPYRRKKSFTAKKAFLRHE